MNSNLIQQIGDVIDKTNHLEMRICDALSLCIKPVNSEYGFLIRTCLNNTVMSFGSKIFLLEIIINYWGWTDLKDGINKFKQLLKLRNSFAHTCSSYHRLCVNSESHEIVDVDQVVSIKESANIHFKNREEEFKKYIELYNFSLGFIKNLENKIRETA